MARRPSSQWVPRLYEVRGLAELSLFLKERSSDVMLVEVGCANMAEVLEFLAIGRSGRNVALLDHDLCDRDSIGIRSDDAKTRLATDALWEAGVADVFESPRSLGRLFQLGERIAYMSAPTSRKPLEAQGIMDWA
jgi:hypothetical protein